MGYGYKHLVLRNMVLGRLKQPQAFISHILEIGKSNNQGASILVSGEGLLLVWRWPSFCYCLHTAEKEGEGGKGGGKSALVSSSYKGSNPIMGALSS